MDDKKQTNVSLNQTLLDAASDITKAADEQKAATSQLKDMADALEEGLKEEEQAPSAT